MTAKVGIFLQNAVLQSVINAKKAKITSVWRACHSFWVGVVRFDAVRDVDGWHPQHSSVTRASKFAGIRTAV
ncbi:MAG: hypothetical protein IKX17_01865 [Prevotella sp.]|nr:hypothetical protein [Prevotella sp.]